MTILTKPFNEKTPDKLVVPLVTDGPFPAASAPLPSVNGDSESALLHRRQVSSVTTIFLFLSAIAVMCMGILGGVAIYRLYAPSRIGMRFNGFCGIPYDSQAKNLHTEMLTVDSDFRNPLSDNGNNIFRPLDKILEDDEAKNTFFREEFELDLSDDESYAKINVPDFEDGRRGRFIHDFRQNQSGIIDADSGRCFIMPLDRETVLPPKSLFDLLNKMWSGYYDIDTERIRRKMRVVTPEITDLSLISSKIARECIGMKIYLLEKYINGVFKRDINPIPDDGKFAEFAGRHIAEYDLININEIKEHEKNHNSM